MATYLQKQEEAFKTLITSVMCTLMLGMHAFWEITYHYLTRKQLKFLSFNVITDLMIIGGSIGAIWIYSFAINQKIWTGDLIRRCIYVVKYNCIMIIFSMVTLLVYCTVNVNLEVNLIKDF
jgi:hypothetical protein